MNTSSNSIGAKPVIVLVGGIHAPSQAKLEALYDVRRYFEAGDKAALLKSVADQCQIVVTNGGRGVEADVMSQLPKLKLVANMGVGYDAVDLAYCKAHKIGLSNTPDVLTEDVADLALSLLLASLRRIPFGDQFVRTGKWVQAGMPLTLSMQGKKILLLGMGRIGQAIAKRCLAFNTEIAYSGPRRKPELSFPYFADVVEGSTWADVVIAALPGGAATQGTMSRAALEALGPQGTFVNIARGSVVDEAALLELLSTGKLGAAGLDVFLNEPKINPAFFELGNTVLHPHQGSATHPTRDAMGDLTLANVAAFLRGEALVTEVLPVNYVSA
jgi:lactate dehydrogenase-like 2-hydroxyacid dehydrogenase